MQRATIKRLAIGIVLALVIGVGFFAHLPTAKAESDLIEPLVKNPYAISQDERYLAYVKYDGGLVWYDLETGVRRVLSANNAGNDGVLKITDDSRTILWMYPSSNGSPVRHSLMKVDIATGQSTIFLSSQTRIQLDRAVSSSDGRYIAFITEDESGTNTASVFDTQTQTLTEVIDYPVGSRIESLTITPNGNTLILHIIEDGDHTIEAVPRTGGNTLVLALLSPALIENVILTPDGDALYFFLTTATQSQLYHVALSAPKPIAIGNAGLVHSGIQFSPDGSYGFYSQRVNGQGGIFRLTLADQSIAPLYNSTIYLADEEHLAITIAPTGNRIVIAEATNGDGDRTINVLSVRYDPIEPARLLTTQHGVNTTADTTLMSRRIPLLITSDGASVLYTQPFGRAFYFNRVAIDGNSAAERLYPEASVQDVRLSQSGDGVFLDVNVENGGDTIYYIDLATPTPKLLYKGIRNYLRFRTTLINNEVLFTAEAIDNSWQKALWRTDLVSGVYTDYSEVATLAEGTSRTITFDLYPSSPETMTVTYSVISGTATLGNDFTLSPATLVFAPGQVSQTLTITALADATIEGLETTALQFENQQTGATSRLDLSFNELIAVSEAPAVLAATSPDGRYAVFKEEHGDLVGLYSKDLATGTRYELHPPDADLRTNHPTFLSPNSHTVLYFKGEQLYHVPFTGGGSTLLVTLEAGCTPLITFATNSFYAQLFSDCANYTDLIYNLNLLPPSASILLFDINFVPLPLAVSPDGNTVIYQREEGAAGRALYVVPTYGDPFIISEISDYIVFDSPTTFLYVRYSEPDHVLTRFDLISKSSTPVFTLPYYRSAFAYEPKRQSFYYFYYVAPSLGLGRYQIGALTPDMLGGDRGTTWIRPVADSAQILYYQEYYDCQRANCEIISGNIGTISAAGTRWASSLPSRHVQVSPNGRTLVYGDWGGSPIRLYQKTFVPMMAERQITAFPAVPNEEAAWRTGDQLLFVVPNNTLQTTTLYEDTPALMQFRNTYMPSLHPTPPPPTMVKLHVGDLLYFQDAEGYLYALGDPTPTVNSTNSEALVAEGETVTVTVSLAAAPLTTATLSVNVVGGTATIGTDVSAPPATLTFAPFQREQSFTLTVNADGITESVEDLRLTFTPISGASAGANNSYRLRISDELYQRHLPLMQHSQ